MKDTHLIIALYRALDRYGSSDRPRGDEVPERRDPPGAPHRDRRRTPGWVTVGEIEGSQSPNTYPRLTRRSIRLRCETLLHEEGSPVLDVQHSPGGLRTWVLVAPPGDAQAQESEDDEGRAAASEEREEPVPSDAGRRTTTPSGATAGGDEEGP